MEGHGRTEGQDCHKGDARCTGQGHSGSRGMLGLEVSAVDHKGRGRQKPESHMEVQLALPQGHGAFIRWSRYFLFLFNSHSNGCDQRCSICCHCHLAFIGQMEQVSSSLGYQVTQQHSRDQKEPKSLHFLTKPIPPTHFTGTFTMSVARKGSVTLEIQ